MDNQEQIFASINDNLSEISQMLNSLTVLKEMEVRLQVKQFNVSSRGSKLTFDDLLTSVAKENKNNQK